KIASDLTEKLKDCDVCMMHDILFQGWHLVHNVAIRKVGTLLPNLRFISFTHSMPFPPPDTCEPPFDARFRPMPNTIFVYPTKSGLPALARQYNVPLTSCCVVSHTYSMLKYKSQPTRKVCDNINLTTPEIIIVYPARLTSAKRLEKVAAFAGAMKNCANGVSLVFCDFPSSDTSSQGYKSIIRHNGKQFGLLDEDILFTSDIGYKNGFPHESVIELFSMSNLYVCPSFAESFGLTVLEAVAGKNVLVLNEAVPALKELGDKFNAYFLRWDALGFGSQTFETYHPSEKAYYNEHCSLILNDMRENKVIQAQIKLRQEFNQEYVFKSQLLSLLNNEK
ncbi:MAG: glycosyltransferase, partial [Clostridia bacterium]